MRKNALLVLPALSLAFAPAPLPKPEPVKEDLKHMQGTWEIVSWVREGQPAANIRYTVEIAGNGMTYRDPDGRVASKWVFTLGAKKGPKTLDTKQELAHAPTSRGLYDLKGDTLTTCYTYDVDRPADFDGNRPRRWLEVWQRQRR